MNHPENKRVSMCIRGAFLNAVIRCFFVTLFSLPGFGYQPLSAQTLTLSEALRKGMEYDATIRIARADNKIYREEIGKARAQLRPNIRVNASRGRSATQHAYLGIWDKPDFYNTVNYGISIRQPLFNLQDIKEYHESKIVAAKSDIDLRSEEHAVMVRIVEAYCTVLFNEDNLALSRSRVLAVKEQLEQSKRRMANGFGTVTEIKEAQAAYDIVLAEGVEVVDALENSKRDFENLTGVYPDRLGMLDASKMKLEHPVPATAEAWIVLAQNQNLRISSAHKEAMIAAKGVEKNQSARYPTFDLIAGRSYSESENNYSIGSTYDTWSVAVQMSVPTYTGGYVSASVRQAKAQLLKAQEQITGIERQVSADIRKYFSGVVFGIAQIHAFEQAVDAGEIALEGTTKGYRAGFRSNVEVLDAQQKLQESHRNLARARYRYILNRLMLRQSAGMLTPADIDDLDGWFSVCSK